jgi:hypothetical protein
MDGATVLAGALAGCGTTLLEAELAELDPDVFVPVTTTSNVKPTSLEVTVYDAAVAPPIGAQL